MADLETLASDVPVDIRHSSRENLRLARRPPEGAPASVSGGSPSSSRLRSRLDSGDLRITRAGLASGSLL